MAGRVGTKQRRQDDTNELKKRFDNFHREARFQEKPFRLLGRAQIANNQVSALIAYPEFEKPGDMDSFPELVGGQMKEFGLEPAESVRQKGAVRVLARLLVPPAEEDGAGES